MEYREGRLENTCTPMTDEYSNDSTFIFNFSFNTRSFLLASPSLIRLCSTNFYYKRLGRMKLVKDAATGIISNHIDLSIFERFSYLFIEEKYQFHHTYKIPTTCKVNRINDGGAPRVCLSRRIFGQ